LLSKSREMMVAQARQVAMYLLREDAGLTTTQVGRALGRDHSTVPERPQRELRELTRYRTSLIRERAAEVNRVQKVLEGANIKLAAVAQDSSGVSGRAMLAALLDGSTDAAAMAWPSWRGASCAPRSPNWSRRSWGRLAPTNGS
jgi:hypothetical protein